MPGPCPGQPPDRVPRAHSTKPAEPGLTSCSPCLWAPTLGQEQGTRLAVLNSQRKTQCRAGGGRRLDHRLRIIKGLSDANGNYRNHGGSGDLQLTCVIAGAWQLACEVVVMSSL